MSNELFVLYKSWVEDFLSVGNCEEYIHELRFHSNNDRQCYVVDLEEFISFVFQHAEILNIDFPGIVQTIEIYERFARNVHPPHIQCQEPCLGKEIKFYIIDALLCVTFVQKFREEYHFNIYYIEKILRERFFFSCSLEEIKKRELYILGVLGFKISPRSILTVAFCINSIIFERYPGVIIIPSESEIFKIGVVHAIACYYMWYNWVIKAIRLKFYDCLHPHWKRCLMGDVLYVGALVSLIILDWECENNTSQMDLLYNDISQITGFIPEVFICIVKFLRAIVFLSDPVIAISHLQLN